MSARPFLLLVLTLVLFQPSRASGQIDRFVDAVRELTAANSENGPGRAAHVRAATERMSTALAEWDRRITILEERVKTATTGADQLHIELGVALRARGRMSDAVREFDAAAALRPSSSDVQVLRALTLESAGAVDEARRGFRAAWTLDKSNAVKAYYALRAGGALAAQDPERPYMTDAYRRLRTATARPSIAPFAVLDAVPDTLSPAPVVGDDLTARGFELLAAGKYTAGVAELRDVPQDAARTADAPAAQFARAREDEAHNRVPDAKREYRNALRGTLTGRSGILVAIARLAQVDGNLDEAIDAFRQAVRLAPNDPILHRELASAYSADGRTEDALCELVAALLIDPLDPQAHAAIGQVYIDTAQYADAVAALNRALELRPAGFEVRYALATALTRAGNASEASRQFELYERERRESLERRRRAIANEVDREERARGR